MNGLCGNLALVCPGDLFKPATHLEISYADRRDRRKSPGVPGAAIAIFADRCDRCISGMSDIGQLNSPVFAKCARSRDFLHSSLRIASKVNPSGWAILSHDFSKLPHRRDRRKKSTSVSTLIGGENRWQSNSPRSAYEIARCVTCNWKLTPKFCCALFIKLLSHNAKNLHETRLQCTFSLNIFIIPHIKPASGYKKSQHWERTLFERSDFRVGNRAPRKYVLWRHNNWSVVITIRMSYASMCSSSSMKVRYFAWF